MKTRVIAGTPGAQTFGQEGTELVIDQTMGAARVKLCPAEYNNSQFQGGHFRVAVTTGLTTGIAAAGALFSMRWLTSGGSVVLKRAQAYAQVTTAFTSPQAIDIDIVRATGFSVADSGGTAITLTGNNNKKRGLMKSSQVNDMRVATTAALTAGTRTQDAQAFGIGVVVPTGAANTALQTAGFIDLYKEDTMAEYPEAFDSAEGFQIRTVTAQGAAGVVRFYFILDWAEVPGV